MSFDDNVHSIVLEKFLTELGLQHLLPSEDDTQARRVEKHRAVQNAMYLVKAVGLVDLGYAFRWQDNQKPLAQIEAEAAAQWLADLKKCETMLQELVARRCPKPDRGEFKLQMAFNIVRKIGK